MVDNLHLGWRILATATLIALLCPDVAPASVIAAPRIRFHVVTVEETKSARNVLSEATIDGPPGTDFVIELRGGRFKMTARFLTDSIASGALAVKARLDTRRLYGYSERDLPLYEEDSQAHDLTLDLQEQIVLLPFGSPGGDERLKVEITPTLNHEADGAATRPDLEIDILRRSVDGAVSIRAFRVPHRFLLNGVLLRNGEEVARGSGMCVIEEDGRVRLHSVSPSGVDIDREPLDLSMGVRQVLRERPKDLVSFDFRLGSERGSGVAPLDAPIDFKVSDPDDPERRDHVLRLTVHALETE